MSDNDRPELRAYRELETLVRNLGDELAAFRKRAISAESQLKDVTSVPPPSAKDGVSSERMSELETENQSLKTRLMRAEERVRQMLDRVRFLRQQLQSQPTGAGRS
jgi:hypothetical protein